MASYSIYDENVLLVRTCMRGVYRKLLKFYVLPTAEHPIGFALTASTGSVYVLETQPVGREEFYAEK